MPVDEGLFILTAGEVEMPQVVAVGRSRMMSFSSAETRPDVYGQRCDLRVATDALSK